MDKASPLTETLVSRKAYEFSQISMSILHWMERIERSDESGDGLSLEWTRRKPPFLTLGLVFIFLRSIIRKTLHVVYCPYFSP